MRSVVLAFLFLLAIGAVSPAGADVVAQTGSASISNDPRAGTWTISARGTALTLGLGPGRDLEVLSFASTSGVPWTVAAAADALVTIGAQAIPLGSRAGGFAYQGVTTSVKGSTVQLDVTYDLAAARIRATRHYAVASGSPTFETWTTFTPLGGPTTVSDLNGFQLTVPAGAVHWINGLQGDDPNQPRDTAFTLQQRELGPGEHLAIGSAGRSSEQAVPWFAVDGPQDEFYAGLMWSGAWSLTITPSSAGLKLTMGLAPMATSVTRPIDGPHAFFGITRGGLPQASAALRSFALEALRGGRPLTPLVTYNTWFAYGVQIDEATMRAEIDGAANLGADLFVVDAGWYVGTGRGGVADFTSGLGTWQVDQARFPSGLGALSDYAHARGLKFGLWVEPERAEQSTINRPGLVQEAWLAKNGGKYGSSQAAQICFASPAARQWVLDQLVRVIDAVHPDYLKWDNNFWLNCDRSGHGHGASDGNFAHVQGLYDVLGSLRARYPDLIVENVSGGGNRLDLGMLRYSDVAWMDDRSAPSVHVRHNIEGLSAAFPPAYLLSFVMDHRDEPLHEAADLSLYFRSRMQGALGLCFRTGEFGDRELTDMSREIGIYKSARPTLGGASGTLLSPQAASTNGPAWDVFQITAFGPRPVVVSAFQSDTAVPEITFKPIGLRQRATYQVESVDGGVLAVATGSDLMANGISIVESPRSAAHVLLLTLVSSTPAR